MQHITEIVPELDTMPEWAENAFRDGNFFNAALAMYQECEPYLKDGETPAQCIARNRKDMTNALKQVAQQMKRAEIAEAMSELTTGSDVTDQQIIEAMQREIDELKTQIDAVRLLPDKWRKSFLFRGNMSNLNAVNECADELDVALKS